MRVLHAITAAALILTAIPAMAASLSSSDSDYLTTAMRAQMGRYALATYEQQHGSGSVKSLGASIASQAAHDSRMLDGLAKRYGVTPPKKLLIQDTFHYGQLQGLQGSQLDNTFVRELRIDDRIAQDRLQQEVQHGQNAALKAYARQHLAAVQHELKALGHM